MEAGQLLFEARQRRNLTLADISRRTKIRVSLLEAIERSDTDRLPPSFFTRAFVRAYANEVGVDPRDVLDDIDMREVQNPEEPSAAIDESATSRSLVFVGLAAACLIYLGYSLQRTSSAAPQTAATEIALPAKPISKQGRGDITLPAIDAAVTEPAITKVVKDARAVVTPAKIAEAAKVITKDDAPPPAPMVESSPASADDAVLPSEQAPSAAPPDQF